MSKLLYLIGSAILSIAWQIKRLGMWFRDKGEMTSPYTKALTILTHTFPEDATMTQKAIDSLKLRKGGCEVQTGTFRRVGC